MNPGRTRRRTLEAGGGPNGATVLGAVVQTPSDRLRTVPTGDGATSTSGVSTHRDLPRHVIVRVRGGPESTRTPRPRTQRT